MQICIYIYCSDVSNVKNFNFEVNESDLIDSLSSTINSELNISNSEYEFICDKVLCESGKTFKELNIKENSKIYALKRELRTRKRHMDEDLNSLLNFGSTAKHMCTISNENYFEHISWKNNGLNEIQSQMTKIFTENPSLIESCVIQPDVENLINNPSHILSFYAANPLINDTINNHPDKVKFFSDASQYDWIKNITQDPKKYENVLENYRENLKEVIDSKRYRRMTELFKKSADKTTNKPKTESDEEVFETAEVEQYNSNVMRPVFISSYAALVIEILGSNKPISDLMIECCPYGSNLTKTNLTTIQNVMPAVIDQWKKAMAHSNDPEKLLQYLQNNPIEMDKNEIQLLEAIGKCEQIEKDQQPANKNEPFISQLVQEITNRFECEKDNSENGEQNFDKVLEVLNEIGFTDNIANIEAVTKERGVLDRAIYRLLA